MWYLISFEKKMLFDSEKINILKYERYTKKKTLKFYFHFFLPFSSPVRKFSVELLLLSDRFERTCLWQEEEEEEEKRR